MKNKRGMSTSSPASSFCSSKQKHSTLAKYGAIYNKIVIMSERKAHVQAPTYTIRCDIICCNPNDILVRLVMRLVECQSGFPGSYADVFL